MTADRSPPRRKGPSQPAPKGVFSGEREPLFAFLPEEVVRNMRRPGSESALLWETFYPFAHDGVSLRAWTAVHPLWGSPLQTSNEDRLVPYFWGLRVDGHSMDGLGQAAEKIAGREDRLEVDLFLRGKEVLIAVEAKTVGEPGRCARYERGRCPEIHTGGAACRYWEGEARFSGSLDFGDRPSMGQEQRPPCDLHYQLARTLLIVETIGRAEGLEPHLCLLLPKRRWPEMRRNWEDFAERVHEEAQWRRLRAVGWEDLQSMRRERG